MHPELKKRLKELGIRSIMQLHQMSPAQLVQLQYGLTKGQLEMLNDALLGNSTRDSSKAFNRRRKRPWVARTRSNREPYSPFKPDQTRPSAFFATASGVLEMERTKKTPDRHKSLFMIERTTHFSKRDPYEEGLFKSLHGNYGEDMTLYNPERDSRPGWNKEVNLEPDVSRTRCLSYMTPELQDIENQKLAALRPKSAHSRMQSTSSGTKSAHDRKTKQKPTSRRRKVRRRKKKKKIACAE
jgi:hypothetical protein